VGGSAALVCALLLLAAPSHGDDGSVAAEALVRAVWFEGIPYEQARALTPQGVRRLVQMLEDPAEAEHHANIVVALGMSENASAYDALARLASLEPRGELDRRQYRVRNALPFALGHLARADRRALSLLEHEVGRSTAPAWSFHHLRGERLRAQLERSAVTALGTSGVPEAEGILDQVGERALRERNAGLAAHAARARELCRRVAREGARRVFGGQP
jgi:hypothetical protein